MKAKSKSTTRTTRKPFSNCAALLHSVRQELQDMGIGDDVSVDGGDAVEYLGRLLPDISEALERDGIRT